MASITASHVFVWCLVSGHVALLAWIAGALVCALLGSIPPWYLMICVTLEAIGVYQGVVSLMFPYTAELTLPQDRHLGGIWLVVLSGLLAHAGAHFLLARYDLDGSVDRALWWFFAFAAFAVSLLNWLHVLVLAARRRVEQATTASLRAGMVARRFAAPPGDDDMEAAEVRAPCMICLERVGDGDRLLELVCGHRFHEECITTWMQRGGACPLRCTPRSGPPKLAP